MSRGCSGRDSPRGPAVVNVFSRWLHVSMYKGVHLGRGIAPIAWKLVGRRGAKTLRPTRPQPFFSVVALAAPPPCWIAAQRLRLLAAENWKQPVRLKRVATLWVESHQKCRFGRVTMVAHVYGTGRSQTTHTHTHTPLTRPPDSIYLSPRGWAARPSC